MLAIAGLSTVVRGHLGDTALVMRTGGLSVERHRSTAGRFQVQAWLDAIVCQWWGLALDIAVIVAVSRPDQLGGALQLDLES